MLKKAVGTILAVFSLAACASPDNTQYIEEIQDASEALSEVENGRFTVTDRVERNGSATKNKENGVFVRTEEGIDWQTRMIMEASDGTPGTKTERISIASNTYERFGRVDEEGRYINENDEVIEAFEWTAANTEIDFLLDPLIDLEMDASFIEEIIKEENEESVVYTIRYNEEFLEQQKEENLSDLQTELESLEEAHMNEQALQALEQNIAYQEGLSYDSMGLEAVVDSDGVLVEYILETEAAESMTIQPGDEPGRMVMTSHIEVLEYNEPTIAVRMEEAE